MYEKYLKLQNDCSKVGEYSNLYLYASLNVQTPEHEWS